MTPTSPIASSPAPGSLDCCGKSELLGALIRQIYFMMIDQVEGLCADTGLGYSQWLALKLIDARQICCVGDIDRQLSIETGASSRLAQKLQSLGLITKTYDSSDRRFVRIEVTTAGQAAVDQIEPRLRKFWDERLQVLSEKQRRSLKEMLTVLHNALACGPEPSAPPC